MKDGAECLADTFLIQITTQNCQQAWSLSSAITANSLLKYEAVQNISASNLINTGADVRYNAANNVVLLPGFQAQSGVKCSASIEGCAISNTRTNVDKRSP